MQGKNPVHTGGFLTGYDHRDFSPEEVAARESCQNSLDAGRNTAGITNLVYQKLIATGKAKIDLLKLLEMESLLKRRLKAFEKEERNILFANSLKKFFDNDTVNALLIRDFNTSGLGGAWDQYEKNDHFARLVCALNLDDKADGDANSGGSFGLGKTAYAKSSKINTVIYHSVFEPQQYGHQRRLMVSGVYPKHKLGKTNYGGFAYFGKSVKKQVGIAVPFHNNEALTYWHKIAEIFEVDISRTSEQFGTDILILMDSLDLQKLRKAVEDYYFPALISNKLSVTFIDEKLDKSHPSLQKRNDLDQFVDLYQKAISSKEVKEETLNVVYLNKFGRNKIGKVAFQSLNNENIKSEKANCVAVMRGTGMVINYVKMGSDQYEPAVGVFSASKEIHKYLQFAENAAHSEWSEHSQRLIRNFPENGQKIVAHVNRIVKRKFLDFQKSLQPDVSVTRSERGLLARLLTGALTGSKGERKPEKHFHNPVSINLTKRRREEEKSLWRLKISDCENTPDIPFLLTLFPSISIAGDSKRIPIKHMKISVKNRERTIEIEDTRPELKLEFTKGETLDFDIEFKNPGKHDYIVQCKCEAMSREKDAFTRK